MPSVENTSGILLDIEGTTSSISFVHDVMFPYVLDHLENFLQATKGDEKVHAACEQVASDAGHESLATWQAETGSDQESLVIAEVQRLMSEDAKATGLKALQGLIWKGGFDAGELQAHSFDDVIPAIKTWRRQGIDVRIYSSGSIAAQKLFFGNLEQVGDCLHLLSGHYDTTFGGKKETESYTRIAKDWGLEVGRILFISDIAEEIAAASQAGLQTLTSVRPGNHPLPEDYSFPTIESFDRVFA